MKSFSQFQEDASSQTQSAISASGSGTGGSDAPNIENKFNRFKKRPSTGLGRVAGAVGGAALGAAGRAAGAIKDRMGRPRPEKPVTSADRKPQTYRDARKTASPKPERGGALAKRPEKTSMVQNKTAAANQPPQHKQISARPASTAMAGSRQRPAIRPSAERKALPPSQQKRVEAQPDRPKLPPGGFRAKDLRARG
jgi:hypothetical protein